MNTIRGHFSHHYTTNIYRALDSVKTLLGFELINDTSLPKEFIYVNDALVGYISWWDSMKFTNSDLLNMKENDFKIIFKYHYSPNIIDYSTYGKYENRIVSSGLWRCWEDEPAYLGWEKDIILNHTRDIDVMASMRHHNSGTIKLPEDKWPNWVNIRKTLKDSAEDMGNNGYHTYAKMINRSSYVNMLRRTKLSYIWSASSYLGWKIPEFIQEGVVMITEPLGKNYPLCNDAIIEDGIHAIFCNNHKKFNDIAISVLKDNSLINDIKKNCLNLWETKLNRTSVGTWYYNKITEAYDGIS
jgi:hypothetical protein